MMGDPLRALLIGSYLLLDHHNLVGHSHADPVLDDVALDVVLAAVPGRLVLGAGAVVSHDLASNAVGSDGLVAGVTDLPVDLVQARDGALSNGEADVAVLADDATVGAQVVRPEAVARYHTGI